MRSKLSISEVTSLFYFFRLSRQFNGPTFYRITNRKHHYNVIVIQTMLAKQYLLIVVAIAVFSLYLMFLLLTNFTDKATKYRPSTQEMRIYTEPVSNKEILRKFHDKINCSRSSHMRFSFQYLNVSIVCFKTIALPCPKWYWDVANGTIIYSNQTFQSRVSQRNGSVDLCIYPVPQDERVQKIIFANGSTQYPGCTWKKRPCAPYLPHYDWELRLRINNSPCCRKLMLDNAEEVTSLFDEHNIPLMVIGGGVMGWARQKEFVPYDFDVDLVMDSRNRSMIPEMRTLLKRIGITLKLVEKNTAKERLWACKRDDCEYSSGIWFIKHLKGNKLDIDEHIHPFEDIFPLQRGTLDGRKFWFPRNPANYLDSVYGKGKWETPYSCDHLAYNDYCTD